MNVFYAVNFEEKDASSAHGAHGKAKAQAARQQAAEANDDSALMRSAC